MLPYSFKRPEYFNKIWDLESRDLKELLETTNLYKYIPPYADGDDRFNRWAWQLPKHATVLYAGTPERCNKTIHADDSVTSPKFPYLYDWDIVMLDLETICMAANTVGDVIFVYGTPLWPACHKIRRIKYWDKNTPEYPPLVWKKDIAWRIKMARKDRAADCFRSGCWHFVLDVDGSELSPYEFWVQSPLRGVSCVVQWTASQGIKPGNHFRLWFVCKGQGLDSRVIASLAAHCYLQMGEKKSKIDLGIYNPCHPIALSAPLDLRPPKKRIEPRAFIMEGKTHAIRWKHCEVYIPHTVHNIIWQKKHNDPLRLDRGWNDGPEEEIQREEKPKKQPLKGEIDNILKEKREAIGRDGHHAQIRTYAIALRRLKGMDEDEIMHELEKVMATCDRMDKNEREWRQYDNERYRRNMARWVVRTIDPKE